VVILYPEYLFSPHYFQIGQHKLHYIDEGQGPVIVMVHGNPTWSYYFRNLITLLSKNHRVIALDHLGCGLSDKPQEYDYCLDNHIANLTLLLDSLQINNCSLIVHDWGGAIGMGYAVSHVESIDKIVILNTAAFRSQQIPLRIQSCRIPFLGTLIVRGCNGFAWPATFMAVEKTLDKKVADAYTAPYDSWNNRIAVDAFIKDIPLEVHHRSYATLTGIENGLEVIKEAKIPMTIIWGGKDFCFNDTFYNEWCQRFPEAEMNYFEHGGHYILEDCRHEIEPILIKFFNS
jgi:cis-3-alkyl-4-acyloxetan-2-one decarboxylase